MPLQYIWMCVSPIIKFLFNNNNLLIITINKINKNLLLIKNMTPLIFLDFLSVISIFEG